MRRPELLAPQAAASRGERAAARLRRDQSGGAVSLWVVLMVPVSAFAAVVAMAGPQRMAAESSMDEAAEDFATLAVAWRDGQGASEGSLHAFPPECLSEGLKTRFDSQITELEGIIGDRETTMDAQLPPRDAALVEFQQTDQATLTDVLGRRDEKRKEWSAACGVLFKSMWGDLGHLGVDMGTLRGFYSDSLKTGELAESINPPLPCSISPQVEVRDAVHVALAADWRYAGWATAQVWPDGARMGSESIGRLRRTMDAGSTECPEGLLDVLDSQGRLDWLEKPAARSRELSQSVPGRTVVEG